MSRPAREKGPNAFRTIGEAAEEVGVAPHVLRFWEGKFAGLRPLKRGGSRRYYRPRDIELLHRIRRLLHDEGYTIKGAAKALRNGNAAADNGDPIVAMADDTENAEPLLPLQAPAALSPPEAPQPSARAELARLRQSLDAIAAECASVAAGNSPPHRAD